MERTLTLQDVTAPDNGGLYSCLAVNDAGNGTAMATLYLEPEFIVQPQDVNTTAGSMINLTCIAEGFPYPEIQWQKMNRTTEQFEDIPGEESSNLVFVSVEFADFGMYRCVATVSFNGQIFVNFSDAALITVSPEGSIMLTPQNMTFDFQDEAVLTCSVEGGPMNEFQWYLNGTRVVSGMINITISSTLLYSTLTISSVSAPLHGGTYQCVVENPAGSDETETMLFVSPRFLQQPDPQTLTQNGSNAILVCRAEAFPVPQYQWTDNLNNMQVVGDPEPLLQFLPANFGDESTYQCHVSSNNLTIYSQLANLHGNIFCS